MKMSKKIRAIASAALISAMVMSMSGMSALAAAVQTDVSTVTLTKKVTVASSSVAAPKTAFNFTVSKPENENVYTHEKDGTIVEVKQGGENGVIVYPGEMNAVDSANKEISFVDADENSFVLADSAYEKTATISFDASRFPKPGVYRYEVKEVAPTTVYDGMSYDSTAIYYLDVYVLNDGSGKKVGYTVVHKNGLEDGDKTDLVFNNTYTTNNLSVKKVISGNQANMSDTFIFNITVEGATKEKYKTDYVDGQGNPVTLVSGTMQRITLGHDQTINIYGLSGQDKFTVVEVEANKDGYTTTYKLGGTAKTSITNELEGDSDKAVEVENNKNATTPTGIIMSFAPYILVLALAGVFAVMFLRKKREDF